MTSWTFIKVTGHAGCVALGLAFAAALVPCMAAIVVICWFAGSSFVHFHCLVSLKKSDVNQVCFAIFFRQTLHLHAFHQYFVQYFKNCPTVNLLDTFWKRY